MYCWRLLWGDERRSIKKEWLNENKKKSEEDKEKRARMFENKKKLSNPKHVYRYNVVKGAIYLMGKSRYCIYIVVYKDTFLSTARIWMEQHFDAIFVFDSKIMCKYEFKAKQNTYTPINNKINTRIFAEWIHRVAQRCSWHIEFDTLFVFVIFLLSWILL